MSEYSTITINAPAPREEELTMLLFDSGALGVAVDDPALIKAHLSSGDWDASVFDAAQIVTGRLTLTATFAAAAADLSQLQQRLLADPELTVSLAELPDVDWQEKWKEGFEPRPLGKRLLIHPCWDTSPLPPERITIEIEPGMAFGTGDHATTAMMLEMIERYLQPDRQVIDLGCGSGILAIAALKLGASQALAIDIDPLCREATARHCQLNDISARQFRFCCGDLLSDAELQRQISEQRYQLVIANINADIVRRLSPVAAQLLDAEGVFLCSGIIDAYAKETEAALAAAGLEIMEHRRDKEWNAYAARARA